MAELTTVTLQLKNEYEEALSLYQGEKAAYDERVRLTAYAKKNAKGVVNRSIWESKVISYKEVEDRFKVNMQEAQQDMIAAKDSYLSALEKENPAEYTKIKAAESKAAFIKKLPKTIAIIVAVLVLLFLVKKGIKKGWFKLKK